MDARRQAVEAARQTAWNVDRRRSRGDHEVAPYIRTARRLRRLGAFGRAVEVIDAAVAPTAIRKNPQALIDRAWRITDAGTWNKPWPTLRRR